ncbi:hypothetical protein GDO81_021188 [Engystomops pustulosus]|uniref:Uncharacterized protein n=1 Tax=Engystomops pustulosus TaxID=76066 RepID=A0AAV6ZAR0_ENGPU|nr:hypothetical protein GDO81_021188 [Engystomops pustulosus]
MPDTTHVQNWCSFYKGDIRTPSHVYITTPLPARIIGITLCKTLILSSHKTNSFGSLHAHTCTSVRFRILGPINGSLHHIWAKASLP